MFNAGSYGTFVEWCLKYFSGATDTLPFKDTGSSHKYIGAHLLSIDNWRKYLDSDNFSEIYEQWLAIQKHKDTDKIVQSIVNSTVNGIDYAWAPLNIVNEAVVQMQLRDLHSLDLKCYNLDVFPTNTKDLKELLINV